jgi:hypothetical protein
MADLSAVGGNIELRILPGARFALKPKVTGGSVEASGFPNINLGQTVIPINGGSDNSVSATVVGGNVVLKAISE